MPPQNNMSLAIVATVLSVLCCGIQSIVTLPLGIIAIVKANSVTNLFFSGQEFQANEAAKNAKTFSIISLCITGVSLIISIIIGFIVVKKVASCMIKSVITVILVAVAAALYWFYLR